jgi:hypothetical protein
MMNSDEEAKLDKWFKKRHEEFLAYTGKTADIIHSKYKVSVWMMDTISLLLQAAYWQGRADEALGNLLYDEDE